MKNRPNKETVTAWARLIRAESVLLAEVHKSLKAAGLPPLAWYDLLLELHRVKDAGLRQFELGEQILLSKHNLSRLIDRLEREGLVDRMCCPEDGRGNLVKITAAGRDLLKQMWPVYGAVIQERFESRLSATEIALLEEILDKVLKPPSDNQTA